MNTITFSTVAGYGTQADADGEILITTPAEDRVGDVLDPEGAETRAYLKNPVVKYAHSDEQLPVAVTTKLAIEPGRGIRAAFRWLKGDAFADRVKNAYDQGILRAASVGFRPLMSEPRPSGRGRRYTKWEMLEWSFTSVPCNPEAVRTLKAMGLWSREPIVFRLTDSPAVARLKNAPPNERIRIIDDRPQRFTVNPSTLADGVQQGLRAALNTRSFHEALRQRVNRQVDAAFNALRGRID